MNKIKTLTIIDDYLKEPEKFVLESKRLKYIRSELNPSNLVSEKSKYASKICHQLIKFNKRKIDWDESSATYRKTTHKDVVQYKNEIFVHSDGITNFVAMLYLSPDKDCHGGTGFFKHKQTGLEGFHDLKAVEKVMNKLDISFEELNEKLEKDARVSNKWILTDRIQMKFNRMMIFNGRIFHSHIFDFKKVNPGSSRLTMLFYGLSK